MMRRLSTRQDERGFFTIWTLGLCICVLFVGGISLDLWRGFSDRRELSALVDGAAVAAANQIDLAAFQANTSENPTVTLDQATARQAALTYLDEQQVDSGIEITAADVAFVGNTVTVTASATTELSLTKIFLADQTLEIETTGSATPEIQG